MGSSGGGTMSGKRDSCPRDSIEVSQANDCVPSQGTIHVCPHGSIVMDRTSCGVTFHPSRKRVSSLVRLLFLFGFAFPLLLTAIVLLFAPQMADSTGALVSLVVFGGIVAMSCLFGAVWYRSSPVTPILVEPTGRVLYGTRVLLDVGANPHFHIETRETGGEGVPVMSYSVVATNRWGPLVRFPGPWFDEFEELGVADWFAEQLALAIRPKAQESSPARMPTKELRREGRLRRVSDPRGLRPLLVPRTIARRENERVTSPGSTYGCNHC
jgi:hypothetical protein